MKKILVSIACCISITLQAQNEILPYQNTNLTVEERVQDLVSRLTLHEKVQLMKHGSPAIPRLGIPAYNWWNEALHGVARTKEKVTVFPQAIGMAATFDTEAMYKMGEITASEGRALFNESLRSGKGIRQYYGLTYWTPNINIFRDPRWGRGQETYGEDPYLTSKLGSAIVKGLEGDNPKYLKSVACAKHYAVHSGPEHNRHSFDARPSLFDLWDTYLPAFRELVTKAKVHGVMCAYNRLDGQPCCGNNPLLVNILRNQWKFDGYVTSDCSALRDFAHNHKTHFDDMVAVSDAMLAGTDLECGNLYTLLEQGVQKGLHSEKDINVSVSRLLTILFKIGMFDPEEKNPYSKIGREVIECKAHKEHAYKMAQESMVLLENKNNILPLDEKKIKSIALIGPNADDEKTLLANYFGTPSEIITPYKSLQARYGNKIKINYIKGVNHIKKIENAPSFEEVAKEASENDIIIFVSGINANFEGEASDVGAGGYVGFQRGDRTSIALPSVQTELMKELKKTGKPIILVNMSGSIMSFEWESKNVDAILQAWYGGQAAGDAIVDVLFGKYNPGGKMPLTTYKSDNDLPSFEDYSMSNRTYRYFRGEPRYPFGYGLSYTSFKYDRISSNQTVSTGKNTVISVYVKNTGKMSGDEVVQLYLTHPQNASQIVPICSLKGFKRIHLKPGEEQKVTFTLTPEDLALTSPLGSLIEKSGDIKVFIGGGQPRYAKGCNTQISITGDEYQVN